MSELLAISDAYHQAASKLILEGMALVILFPCIVALLAALLVAAIVSRKAKP